MNKEYIISKLKSIRKKASTEDILDKSEETVLTKMINFLEAMPDYEDMDEDYNRLEEDDDNETKNDGWTPF